MIASLGRPSPVLRRIIAIILAVVLALLVLAPNATASGTTHAATATWTGQGEADHGMPAGSPADCHRERTPVRTGSCCDGADDSGCPSTHGGPCATMAGCSAVTFVASAVPTHVGERVRVARTPLVQHALTRATVPDLPPPRA